MASTAAERRTMAHNSRGALQAALSPPVAAPPSPPLRIRPGLGVRPAKARVDPRESGVASPPPPRATSEPRGGKRTLCQAGGLCSRNRGNNNGGESDKREQQRWKVRTRRGGNKITTGKAAHRGGCPVQLPRSARRRRCTEKRWQQAPRCRLYAWLYGTRPFS